MRRFLDLNQPGMVFLKVIGFLLVLLPAVLYTIVQIASEPGRVRVLLLSLIKISFAVGVVVSIVFLVLIVVEQIQDHTFDASTGDSAIESCPWRMAIMNVSIVGTGMYGNTTRHAMFVEESSFPCEESKSQDHHPACSARDRASPVYDN